MSVSRDDHPPVRGVDVHFLDTDEHHFSAEQRRTMRAALAAAEDEVRPRLRALPATLSVTVYPTRRVIAGMGTTGHTAAKDWIQASINPWDPRGVLAVARTELRALFAHEAHHAARMAVRKPDPLDARIVSIAVFEGLATVFACEITGEMAPWGVCDPELADEWIAEIAALPPAAENGLHWRFQHPDGRQWIAYRAGTRIVERACAAMAASAAELVDASVDDILEAAQLAP